jgi:hypothetical protein
MLHGFENTPAIVAATTVLSTIYPIHFFSNFMKTTLLRLSKSLSISLLVTLFAITFLFTTRSAQACACGCGVFDVGTLWNLPNGPGGMVYTEYNFSLQSHNWHNLGPSAAANNGDRIIQTSWLTAGVQYFFNNKWGVELQVPTANRLFVAGQDDGTLSNTGWYTLGDIRLMGYYTGFSPDMSTGLQFGLKLPTGTWTEPNVDRDTQIGTGSTDILLGFYTHHPFAKFSPWNWFAQSLLDLPVYGQGGYHPGVEVDSAAGVYYNGLKIGRVQIQPIAQMLVSNRASDNGPAADPQDSGYQRVMLSPGIQIDIHPIRIYADAELPVINDVVGQQLISQCLVKVNVSYMF